jgi:hypothetical protein
MLAGRLVYYDKVAHILALQLLIGIQKLNSVNRPIRRHIHHQLVTYPYRFNLIPFFAKTDVTYIMS